MHTPNPGSIASAGSSSHASSGAFQRTTRQFVDPFIKTDLQYVETCSIHHLLGVLLDRCRSDAPNHSVPPVSNPSTPNIPQLNESGSLDNSPNGSDKTEKAETKPSSATQHSDPSGGRLDQNDLLEVCLRNVLPLCNEEGFRNLIRAYCNVPMPETQRYPPFTKACNYALGRLRALDIPHLRPPSSCEILFHVNDPIQIIGYKSSHRVPDVTIVSLGATQRVHRLAQSWAHFAEGPCQAKPPLNFEWSEVLGFAEFKRFNPITPRFPDKFDCSLHDPVPLQTPPDLELLGTASSASATNSIPSSISTTNTPYPESKHFQMAASENGRPSSDTSLPTAAEGLPGNVLGTTHGTKRPREGAESSLRNQGGSKKQKGDPDEKIQEGLVQCGTYAAEMLSRSTARQHAIGLFIVDGEVWVWWYDRQGAIQSSGIDLSRDLPLFAVLLLVLQRFSRADWGYNPILEPQASRGTGTDSDLSAVQEAASLRVASFPGLDVSIDLDDVRSCSFGLIGRGTLVLGAGSSSPGMRGRELVAKLSWPDKTRLSVEAIIEQAIKRAPSAEDHLPKVFASRDGYDTEVIRRQLGINQNSRRPPRIFRMTIFERLYAITSVSGPDCIAAYVQCVKCHYLAWQAGVQHRDLSLANLMLRKRGNDYLGVLNDWDFAYIDGLSTELGERGATIPFLALELLQPEFWDGKIAVEYKHDLESFIWIVYWLAQCSESPDGKPPKDMLEWNISAMACHKAKSSLLQRFRPTDLSTAIIESRVAFSLLRDFIASVYERQAKMMRGTWVETDEPSNESRLENFLQVVSRAVLPQEFQLPQSPVVQG
ncbi:hypothetical protein FRC08_011320 [Ceratobasidium sp. 394]|nr:hypothetical protein FRC08_011320 [Ceratobasidium sp. 394]